MFYYLIKNSKKLIFSLRILFGKSILICIIILLYNKK